MKACNTTTRQHPRLSLCYHRPTWRCTECSVHSKLLEFFQLQLQRLAQSFDSNRNETAQLMLNLFGVALMALGECINFISSGMAPSSLVAPMDAVAILSNVLLSRLLLQERLSRLGVMGCDDNIRQNSRRAQCARSRQSLTPTFSPKAHRLFCARQAFLHCGWPINWSA